MGLLAAISLFAVIWPLGNEGARLRWKALQVLIGLAVVFSDIYWPWSPNPWSTGATAVFAAMGVTWLISKIIDLWNIVPSVDHGILSSASEMTAHQTSNKSIPADLSDWAPLEALIAEDRSARSRKNGAA